VAGGQARPAAPVSSNAVQAFAQKPELAGFGVHAIGANGQVDSTLIGDWTPVGATTARVRFVNANQARLVTVLISTGSPVAHVTAGDRSDSLRVTRIVCQR
jgi:putative aminopeptidase FrvX